MGTYLRHRFSRENPDLVSILDELPLWSAPFGLKLLDTIELRSTIKVLDIGCGLGFPLVELAQRLGSSCLVTGVDPWERALERIVLKLKTYKMKQIIPIKAVAEQLPFPNNLFDLIVSNNGINNVDDMECALSECFRVSKPNAQFTVTLNMENTMIEFYTIFEDILRSNNLKKEIINLKNHIHSKRKPLDKIKLLLSEAGFKIKTIDYDDFKMKFLDSSAMFHHSLIKYWFLDDWKKILKSGDLVAVFEQIEHKVDKIARDNEGFCLTIPFVTIDCRRM